MIEILDLKKYYDKTLSLSIGKLVVEDGCILGLVGTNGSGKSTLLRLIAGVLSAEEGDVLLDGVSVKKHPECKKELLYISDDPIDHVNTSVDSLLSFYSLFYGMKQETFYSFLDKFSIPHKGNLSKFSKGMRRRTYLAVALAVEPKLLLLDEAFDGLDPQGKKDFIAALGDLVEKKNMTVIVASHSLRELEDLCDSYLLLKNGKVISYAPEGVREEEYTKVTVAFSQPFGFFALNDPRVLVVSHLDKIGTLYFAGSEKQAEEYLSQYEPVVMDFSPMSAEEYFIFKTEEHKND